MTSAGRPIAVVLLAALAGACLPEALAPPGPAGTVARLHAALRAGDLPAAHALVDYGARLDEVLGDIWRAGSDEDRAAAEARVARMMEGTAERYRAGERSYRLRARPGAGGPGGDVWIEARSRPLEDGEPTFAWLYRLRRGPDGWRVVQREAVVGGGRAETARFWQMVLTKLRDELGRPPTLAEVTANLDSFEGRARARVFRVPRGATGGTR